jgi:hypothetical protein
MLIEALGNRYPSEDLMFRKVHHSKNAGIALLLWCIVWLGCNQTVVVTIIGPSELSNASIYLDGSHIGELSQVSKSDPSAGILAQLSIPQGRHDLEIRHSDFPPILRKLDYREADEEDYILIPSSRK